MNLRGVFLGCKFACAQFLKQELDSSGHRGWIVNTASILGLVGMAGGAGELFFFFSFVVKSEKTSRMRAKCAN